MKFNDNDKVLLVLYKISVQNENMSSNVNISLSRLYHECYNFRYPVTLPALVRSVNELSQIGFLKSERIKRNRIITITKEGKIVGKELHNIEMIQEKIKKIVQIKSSKH